MFFYCYVCDQVSLGSFGAFPIFADLVHAASWKRLIVEWTDQIWASGVSILVYIRYFWLLSVQVQFGSFGAFPIFGNLVSQKRLIVEQNGWKFGPQTQIFNVYRVLLTVKCSSSVGVIGCISNIWWPVFFYRVTKQSVKAPGPLVIFLSATVHNQRLIALATNCA